MENRDTDTDTEKIKLLDLIDEKILKHLLTGFCEQFDAGMKIVCYNSENELRLIEEIPGQTERLWSEICKLYRKNIKNSKSCDACDLKKAEALFNSDNPQTYYYFCDPLGMVDMIAPIMVRQKVIGAVITGQRLLKENVDSILQHICQKYPELSDDFKKAIQKEKEKSRSKICSLKEIEDFLSELQGFANLIGNICDIDSFEREKKRSEAFFDRVAHYLSLPMQSALIDSYNLLKENNSEDTKRLYNSLQGLSLVVQNILHGSGRKTIQGKPRFTKKHITTSLEAACEMFKSEAKEKGCDLRVSIKVFDYDSLHEISDLKDINLIYKKIICEKFDSFPKQQSDNWCYIIKEENVNSDLKTISELVEHCYQMKQGNKTFEVFDAETDKKIEFDFSKLSKYFMTPIKMNFENIDLAFKNLIHNAVKYSFETTPNSSKRYVSINFLFENDKVDIEIVNYGVGITNKEITEGKIWEPRYRGYLSQDRNRCGAGLGLPHAKEIVDEHKGEIICTSTPQKGGAYLTIFTVRFNNKNNT